MENGMVREGEGIRRDGEEEGSPTDGISWFAPPMSEMLKNSLIAKLI